MPWVLVYLPYNYDNLIKGQFTSLCRRILYHENAFISALVILSVVCTLSFILVFLNTLNGPCIIITSPCFLILPHMDIQFQHLLSQMHKLCLSMQFIFSSIISNEKWAKKMWIPIYFCSCIQWSAVHQNIFFIYTFTLLAYRFFLSMFSLNLCSVFSPLHSGMLHKTNFLTGVWGLWW